MRPKIQEWAGEEGKNSLRIEESLLELSEMDVQHVLQMFGEIPRNLADLVKSFPTNFFVAKFGVDTEENEPSEVL